jgi:broad specificity phosphatase PhoE
VVCVSHQLPVEILRRSMIGKRLPHDPRKRMCGLASLNTFVFEGDTVVDWQYQEPAQQ